MKPGSTSHMMQVSQTALPNGLRIISARLPHVESVAMGVWIAAGSRVEPARLAGVSHFIEHLLFKGTARRSAREISNAIEGRGGYLDAFTQEENTCYYARVAREHAEAALDVLADMVLHPRFDPGELDKERSVILDEIQMYRDQPQHVVHERLTEALWKNHALGRPVAGNPASVRAMSRVQIQRFKREHYTAANMVVAFAGRTDHAQCVAQVASRLGRMPPARKPAARHDAAAVGQEPVVYQQKDVEQTHLALGFRHFGRHDRRRHGLRLLNAILGENMSSRLFQVLREKHGLAYSIQSSFQLFEETGALTVSAGLDGERTERAMELMVRELRRLREKPVGARELKQAKEYLVGHMKLGLESTSNQMMWIGEQLLSFGRFIPPEEVIREITSVGPEDLRRLACSVFRGGASSVSLVAPGLEARRVAAIGEMMAGLG